MEEAKGWQLEICLGLIPKTKGTDLLYIHLSFMRFIISFLFCFIAFFYSFSVAQKFWLTTYEFPYGPKTGISLINDSVLFVGTENRVIRSTNSGYHFTESLDARSIYTVFISKAGNVYAGGDGKIYKSENLGLNWDSVSLNSNYPVVQIIENNNGNLFAITNGYDIERGEMSGENVLFSDNQGQTWTVRNTGLKLHGGCNKMAVDKNNRLYVAVIDDNVTGAGGLYFSDNDGQNWIHADIGYTGEDTDYDSPRVQVVSGLSVLKNDSIHLSFAGINVNFEVRLNMRKHINDVDNASIKWNVYKVSNTNSWWLDRCLNNIYEARNGDRYSSYSQTLNIGGTYFKKVSNPWNRIDAGLGLAVNSMRTEQHFVENPDGKIFMIQKYDERIYWADTSAVTTNIPYNPVDNKVFICPSQIKSGTFIKLKMPSGQNCSLLNICDLSGRVISSVTNQNLIKVPYSKGIYLLKVRIDDKDFFRKIMIN